MNMLAQVLEMVFGTDDVDQCDVFLCGNDHDHVHTFNFRHEDDETIRLYCESHYKTMTGAEP